ncbi:MAG: hypothetical protein EBW68_11850, partial [Actinobacteria bacterium]|nr:hypothetical protein [Actinomycetota bacterium]
SSGHADVWLNETFEIYTAGEVINNVKSPLLITNVSNSPILYTRATNTNSGIMMRYQKSTTSNGQTVAFLLTSDTNTTRTNGYFSIKVNQNVDASIPVGNNLYVRLGNNTTNSLSTSSNGIVELALYQSATTNNLRIKSGGVGLYTNSYGTSNLADPKKFQVWFNDSDTTPMAYTNPSGVAQNLPTNSFIVYMGTTLMGSSTAGYPLAGGANADLKIQRLGWGTGSTTTIDFSLDDVYAGDTAPLVATLPIASATTASAMVGYPFTFQVLAEANTYGATSLPDGLSINPTSGLITGTPTTAGPSTAALSVSNAAGVTGSGNLTITVATAPTSIPVMGGATT